MSTRPGRTYQATTTTAGTAAVPPAPGIPRLLGGTPDLAEHLRRHGPLPAADPDTLLDAVGRSGLTGRGGAAFPTGRKMLSVLEASNARRRGARRRSPVVVANGCEGEPASAKDKTLLTLAPHLVLDGIALASRIVGAERAHLCLHEDDSAVIDTVVRALAERRAAGIEDAGLQVTLVPHRYVASEASSLVRLLNGGPALPMFAPPRPHQRGVEARPTLVNNVETLAHLALITRHGPDWFRSAGTSAAPGTALLTVTGAVARPGVYEIPLGITGADLLALAGGASEPLQAVLAGGYFGAWLPDTGFAATRISAADLTAAGAGLGAGVFVALPAASCGLAETARVARYLAEESAGQCGPCLHGLPALATALESLALGGDRNAPHGLKRLMPYVTGRGACRHPDGATRLIASALAVFARDRQAHVTHGPCGGVRRAPILPVPAPATHRPGPAATAGAVTGTGTTAPARVR
jgi:NADH:ubiquinone oxidoreductase subunit F (NADH-binding)